METRPPVLIAWLVRQLTPREAREHVLGDLWERYVSPRRFVADAATTLPYVFVSQARRNISPVVFQMQAFILFWVCGGIRLAEPTFTGVLAVVLPMLAGLAILICRDVYSARVGQAIPRAFIDVLLVVFCIGGVALLLTAWLDLPQLMLSAKRPGRYGGGVAGIPILFLLRMGQRREYKVRHPLSDDDLWSITDVDLKRLIAGGEQRARLHRIVELAWGGAVLLVLLVLFWMSDAVVHRTGVAVSILGILFMLGLAAKRIGEVHTSEKPLTSLLRFYREQLERERDALTSLWWVYPLPLLPGGAILMLGLVLSRDEATYAPALTVLALAGAAAIATACFNHYRAGKLQREITRLITADEVIAAKPRRGGAA